MKRVERMLRYGRARPRVGLGLAACLLLLRSAQAADPFDGHALLGSCTEAVKAANGDQEADGALASECLFYIAGFRAGQTVMMTLNSGLPGVRRPYCEPAGATGMQEVRMVERYLIAHPEKLEEQALSLVADALHDGFPCP